MAKQGWLEKLQRFAEGKKLKWLGWVRRGSDEVIYAEGLKVEPTYSCNACGSKSPQIFAVLLDINSGQIYLVGNECYRKLPKEEKHD